ncbi:hypothetical protein ACQEVF_14155 [Nonomuraea polychroma]|uniref:hypothetical protein n=1 Tax=Nonomuraea polychroma TaxID=46176 RepID=UPI003D8E0D81
MLIGLVRGDLSGGRGVRGAQLEREAVAQAGEDRPPKTPADHPRRRASRHFQSALHAIAEAFNRYELPLQLFHSLQPVPHPQLLTIAPDQRPHVLR